MLDYKNIIIKRYALSLSGSEIARQLGASKSGVNDFLRAFDKCESLSYPLPPGITNYGIAELVYGSVPGSGGRNENIEYPDYEATLLIMGLKSAERLNSSVGDMEICTLQNRAKLTCHVLRIIRFGTSKLKIIKRAMPSGLQQNDASGICRILLPSSMNF